MMMIYLSTCLIRKIYIQTLRPCTKTKRTGERTSRVKQEEKEREEGKEKGGGAGVHGGWTAAKGGARRQPSAEIGGNG